MKINTSVPILGKENSILNKITLFWDKISPGWLKLWGQHIHHGYFDSEKTTSITLAQERLIHELTKLISLKNHSKILDVGSGLGGSALFLAQKFQAEVTGISLSATQVALAKQSIPKELSAQLNYKIEDAHCLNSFQENDFDVVWALESVEQFYDKEKFIQEAMRVLKPGGKLMIATWCANQTYYEGESARKYLRLCNVFHLPYMPSIETYSKILKKYAMQVTAYNWSTYVNKSWEMAIDVLKQYSWLTLLSAGGLVGFRFVKKLHLMNEAFQSGLLQYGVLIAEK